MGNLFSRRDCENRDMCVQYNLLPLAIGSDATTFIKKNKIILSILYKHNIQIQSIQNNQEIYFWCPIGFTNKHFETKWITGKCPFVQLILPDGYYFAADARHIQTYYLFDKYDNMIFTISVRICGYDNFYYSFVDNSDNEYTEPYCHHKNSARIKIFQDSYEIVGMNVLESFFVNYIVEEFYDEIDNFD